VVDRRREVAVRLSGEGIQRTEQQLNQLGTRGQQALQRIERAGAPASRSLLAVDRAAATIGQRMTGLAGNLGTLGGSLSALGPIGLAAAAGLGGLTAVLGATTRLAQQSIERLSAIGDVADRLGLTAEQLQELRFAAEQNNVAAEQLDTAFQRFTRRLGEAQQGAGVLKQTLEDLGVSVRNADGSTRSAVEVYRDFADAVAAVQDPQKQLAISVAAFDVEGARLVRLLRQGAEGFDDLARAGRESGAVLSNDLVAAGLAAGDEINALQQSSQAALTELGALFIDQAVNWQAAKTTVVEVVRDIAVELRALPTLAEGLGSQLRAALDLGPVRDLPIDQLPEAIRRKILASMRAALPERPADFPTPIPPPEPPPPPKPPKPVRQAARGLTEQERELQRLRQRGLQIAEQVRTQQERYRDTLVELQTLEEAGAISAETRARAQAAAWQQLIESAGEAGDAGSEAARQMEAAWDEAARSMTRDLTEFLTNGEFSFRRFAANIAAALIQAQLQAQVIAPLQSLAGGALGSLGSALGNLFGFAQPVSNIGPTGLTFANELAAGLRPVARGGVFAGGRLTAFASGGVVDRPTLFPLRDGTGLMGEAGPEAVMPLTRRGDGRLGVLAEGGGELRIVLVDETGGQARVEPQLGRRADGVQELRLLIRNTVFDLFDTGAIDNRLAPFGVQRRGIG